MEHKLGRIASQTHLQALLAAMFSFAMYHSNKTGQGERGISRTSASSTYYFDLACRLVAQGLEDCGDDSPPLCLLQALIITTLQKLIDGVRGKAWRSLGECVRIAYELQLHLVDLDDEQDDDEIPDVPSHSDWIAKEERRRAWYAIWEFDVFASTIRRLPVGQPDVILESFSLPVLC